MSAASGIDQIHLKNIVLEEITPRDFNREDATSHADDYLLRESLPQELKEHGQLLIHSPET